MSEHLTPGGFRKFILKTQTKAGGAFYFRKMNKSYSVTFNMDMAKTFATHESAYEFKTKYGLTIFDIIEINKGKVNVEEIENNVAAKHE